MENPIETHVTATALPFNTLSTARTGDCGHESETGENVEGSIIKNLPVSKGAV